MSDRPAPAAPARSAGPVERLGPTGPVPRDGAHRPSPSRLGLIVVVALVASSVGVMAAPAATLGWSPNAFSSASEQQLMALTNQARASAGRKALRWDSALGSIARWRSRDMIKRDYFSHDIPGAGKVFDEMSARGYCYKVAGENIGWNTYPDDVATAQIQSMFMGSSGHRANILGKDWDRIGIGAYKGKDGKKMWTVLFADRCGSGPVASKPNRTPEELIALAETEFAWCDQEMRRPRARWDSATTGRRRSRRPRRARAAWRQPADDSGSTPRGDRLPSRERSRHRAAGRRRVAAHDHDDAGASAGEPVLHGRGTDQRFVSDQHDGVRGAHPEHARQQRPGFSHATAFHEMIPGHNLVGFMGARFNDYRANLSGGGPFFGEGWPLYWELILYDMGFDKTPERQVGALFWRMHRCARIIFSLKFHLGQWSPQEAIDFLVDRVGHERDNATRRSRCWSIPAAATARSTRPRTCSADCSCAGSARSSSTTKIMTSTQFHDEISRSGRDADRAACGWPSTIASS